MSMEGDGVADEQEHASNAEPAAPRAPGIDELRHARMLASMLRQSLNEVRGEMDRMSRGLAGGEPKAAAIANTHGPFREISPRLRAEQVSQLDEAFRDLRNAMTSLSRGQGQAREREIGAATAAVEATTDGITNLIAASQQIDDELNLAQALIDQLRNDCALTHANVNHYLRPAERVSGDFILGAEGREGFNYYLLGDFTGHGFAAALAIMAVHTTFTDLATRGARVQDIASALNGQLRRLLPADRFLAAVIVEIFRPGELVTVCNAGMPDVLLRKGERVVSAIPSASVPLGIVSSEDLKLEPARFDLCAYDALLTCSDGMTEAPDADGEAFGLERLKRAFELSRSSPAEEVAAFLERHLHPRAPVDDVSALSIRLGRYGWV